MPKTKENRIKTGAQSQPVKLVTKRGKSVGVVTGRHVYLLPVLDASWSKPENKMTPYEKMELVEEGISKKALQGLKDKAGLDYNQLATILNVARATLINKKGNEKFSKDVSDKILGLADIYAYGYQVFDDRDRFNEWIFRPNAALGKQSPFDLLYNSFGREEIKNLIGRIDYGVYS
jgi:putative toxin-antitoxin system antitoxin component (TIGR02293 family)